VWLKLQPGFAGCVCKCFDSTMIFVVPAVQADRLDSGSRRFFRDQLADFGGGVTVPAMIDLPTDCLVACADTDERPAG